MKPHVGLTSGLTPEEQPKKLMAIPCYKIKMLTFVPKYN